MGETWVLCGYLYAILPLKRCLLNGLTKFPWARVTCRGGVESPNVDIYGHHEPPWIAAHRLIGSYIKSPTDVVPPDSTYMSTDGRTELLRSSSGSLPFGLLAFLPPFSKMGQGWVPARSKHRS